MPLVQESPRCRREVELPPWFGNWSDMEEEPIEVPDMQAKEIWEVSHVDVQTLDKRLRFKGVMMIKTKTWIYRLGGYMLTM